MFEVDFHGDKLNCFNSKLSGWMGQWHLLTAPEIADLLGFFSCDLKPAGSLLQCYVSFIPGLLEFTWEFLFD